MADPAAPALDEQQEAFLRDVLDGLSRTPKALPSKYFYDARGSELFERITELPEYYPTRTELAILEAHAGEMAAAVGPGAVLIEYGSGSSRKIRLLLDRLAEPAAYVPVDISAEHLRAAADEVRRDYPGLRVEPVAADYTSDRFALPDDPERRRKRVVVFPGSTIGNFDREDAAAFLGHIAGVVGPGGGLLIGVDLKKDPALLLPAYDDAAGVTAAFNRNVLHHINAALGADFEPEAFEHRAVWDEAEGRVEMHLVSRRPQEVSVGGRTFRFAAGDAIHTESSHKYTLDGFAELAAGAGFRPLHCWTDADGLFSVQYLEVAP